MTSLVDRYQNFLFRCNRDLINMSSFETVVWGLVVLAVFMLYALAGGDKCCEGGQCSSHSMSVGYGYGDYAYNATSAVIANLRFPRLSS